MISDTFRAPTSSTRGNKLWFKIRPPSPRPRPRDDRRESGLFFLVDLDQEGPAPLEAVPLKLEYCHTRLATGNDAELIGRRFREACRALGTEVDAERDRLVVTGRP